MADMTCLENGRSKYEKHDDVEDHQPRKRARVSFKDEANRFLVLPRKHRKSVKRLCYPLSLIKGNRQVVKKLKSMGIKDISIEPGCLAPTKVKKKSKAMPMHLQYRYWSQPDFDASVNTGDDVSTNADALNNFEKNANVKCHSLATTSEGIKHEVMSDDQLLREWVNLGTASEELADKPLAPSANGCISKVTSNEANNFNKRIVSSSEIDKKSNEDTNDCNNSKTEPDKLNSSIRRSVDDTIKFNDNGRDDEDDDDCSSSLIQSEIKPRLEQVSVMPLQYMERENLAPPRRTLFARTKLNRRQTKCEPCSLSGLTHVKACMVVGKSSKLAPMSRITLFGVLTPQKGR